MCPNSEASQVEPAVLARHRGTPAEGVLTCERIAVDALTRDVIVEGQAIHLTPNEFELCRLRVAEQGRVLTQHHILSDVWGFE